MLSQCLSKLNFIVYFHKLTHSLQIHLKFTMNTLIYLLENTQKTLINSGVYIVM